jgi:nucleoid DNA-binding protein
MYYAAQGKTMTKADIVERIYEKVGFSKKESAELVELVFDIMKSTIESGEKIKVAGLAISRSNPSRTVAGVTPRPVKRSQLLPEEF